MHPGSACRSLAAPAVCTRTAWLLVVGSARTAYAEGVTLQASYATLGHRCRATATAAQGRTARGAFQLEEGAKKSRELRFSP